MNDGVRIGIANAVDFTVNQIRVLADDPRGEFFVDIDFRSEHGDVWNPRFPVVATLTRGGVLMEAKDGRKHRVSAAQPASFHPLIAELEHAVDRWISALERSVQPQRRPCVSAASRYCCSLLGWPLAVAKRT
jgi:hypothetical protein